MTQGASRSLKTKPTSGGRKKTGKTPKGKRVVAPKDVQLVKEKVHMKQLSSKINNSIERQMVQAASAGKLTIMRNSGDVEAGAGKDAARGKGKGQGKGKGKA